MQLWEHGLQEKGKAGHMSVLMEISNNKRTSKYDEMTIEELKSQLAAAGIKTKIRSRERLIELHRRNLDI